MKTNWLFSTIGKRGYIADYLREADPNAHIIGSGRTQFTPGFANCDESVLMPDILSAGYLDAVRQLITSHRIDAILSFSDPDVAALSTIRAELAAKGVSCFYPDPELARMGYDKLETARWATLHGLNTPNTLLDPLEAIETLGLPLIRKPRFGSASVGVAMVHDARDLLPPQHDSAEYIYQEFIDGEEVNVEICGDLVGRPIGVSAWKKLLSRYGETELAVTVRRQSLIDYGIDLAEKASIVGPCDVDIIERDGRSFLIEFNMRFGGGYPASHLAGAAFPDLLVRVQKGEHPALHTAFVGDIFMMKALRPFGGPLHQAGHLLKTSVPPAGPGIRKHRCPSDTLL